MKKKVANFAVLALGLALIVYGALRSYDFLSMTVPADRQWWAFAGLAASELGMLGWLVAYLWHEGSTTQNATALVMMIVDFLGSSALSTADMFLVSGENGLIAALTPGALTAILIGLGALVIANVGAGILHLASDPGAAKARARREVFATIEDEALKRIEEHAQALAAELSAEISRDFINTTKQAYRAKLTNARTDTPANTSGLHGKKAAELPVIFEAENKELPEIASMTEPNPTPRRRKQS